MICAIFPGSACAGPVSDRGRRALYHQRAKGGATLGGNVTMCDACQAAFEKHRAVLDSMRCRRPIEYIRQAPEGATGLAGIDMTGTLPCGGRLIDGKCESCDVTMIEAADGT